MSTLQPRIHSPQSRQPYSPKLASPNPLSPPNSGHHSKKSQKHSHKSPKSSKDKRSPNKNSSLKSNYDTKVTDANSPSRSKGQSTTTTGRKNQPKSKHNSENALTFDNRLDNKPRQLDHHVLYPQHDEKVPYKQKSHSVKSVSVPHELLVSPKSYDPNLAAALLNKKPQTAKHANFNEAEFQDDYNTDLMTMYNNRQEEHQFEARTNKGNKFFSSSKQKKDSEISKRKVNTPETSPPSRAYQNERPKKFKNKVSPRAYEIIVGSPARGHNSQSNQQQKTYKTKNGIFMQGPLPGIEEQFEENVKVYSVKSAEFRNRTGSMPNDTYEAFYDTDGNSRSPARTKTTKNSEPNAYSDPNIYNKRASESQVQVHQVMQSGKDKYVSSTRSAFEPIYEQGNEKDQFMNDILKHNALRELKVNPNAKFLLLREQVRERRNRTGFKSADWNATEEITKHASQHQTSPTKNYNMSPPISPILCQSPNVLKSIDVSTSPIRDSRSVEKENVTHNDQLVQLFNKTKNILASYKNKEQDWDKERKMFISEIKRLRGLLKETVN